MPFSSRLLRAGDQPRPFTVEELAGYPAEPEDFSLPTLIGVAQMGEEKFSDPNLIPKVANDPAKFRQLYVEYQKLKRSGIRFFQIPRSLARQLGYFSAAAVGAPTTAATEPTEILVTTIIDPVHNPVKRELEALYGILQYAEAYRRLHGDRSSPAEWEQWRQTGLSGYNSEDFAVMMSLILRMGDDHPFRDAHLQSVNDFVLPRATNFRQYLAIDLLQRLSSTYWSNSGQILFAYDYHPDYETWEDVHLGDIEKSFIRSLQRKTLYDIFPLVFGIQKSDDDTY